MVVNLTANPPDIDIDDVGRGVKIKIQTCCNNSREVDLTFVTRDIREPGTPEESIPDRRGSQFSKRDQVQDANTQYRLLNKSGAPSARASIRANNSANANGLIR